MDGMLSRTVKINIRMDMLKRLLGPWDKGATKEQAEAWRQEWEALSEQAGELDRLFVGGKMPSTEEH